MRVAEPLAEALRHAPRDRLTFMETERGAARTAAGFGGWWASACRAAGVTARAHGLRHTLGAEAAEEGLETHSISAALGHSSSAESIRYTKTAKRRRMADAVVTALELARGNGTSDEPRSKPGEKP